MRMTSQKIEEFINTNERRWCLFCSGEAATAQTYSTFAKAFREAEKIVVDSTLGESIADSDNWNFDDSDEPFWFSLEIGEMSTIHLMKLHSVEDAEFV